MNHDTAAMLMMSDGGNKSISNMVELIDGLPTLYTLTAGEFTFDFKIPTDLIFHENFFDYTGSDGGFEIITFPSIYFVCKRGSQIICATGEICTSTGGSYSYRKSYDSKGSLTYSRIFTDAKIISVRLNIDYYGKLQGFMVFGEMTYKYCNSEGNEGFFTGDIPWTYISIFKKDAAGSIPFYTSLNDDEFAFAYLEAIKALKKINTSISESDNS